MKTHVVSRALSITTVGVVVFVSAGAGIGTAGPCPYDILAMCCVERSSSGKCTRWINCCGDGSWLTSGSDSGASATQPLLVADSPCVRNCNRRNRSKSARESCYATCAKPPSSSTVGSVASGPAGHPGLGGPTRIGAAVASVPMLTQLPPATANVPMKHGSCGTDCGTHVLATNKGNLKMKFRIQMSCPNGTDVNHLSYRIQGGNVIQVFGNTSSQSVEKNLDLQPFTAGELEQSCRSALGGNWATPGSHHNATQAVSSQLSKSIDTWGRCSGWANKVKRTYQAKLTLTCNDTGFFVPPQ